MKSDKFLVVVITCLLQAYVSSLRLLELRVPAHVAEGSDVLLGCLFDLENDSLYSVKWYKDNVEFYRYIEYEKRSMTFRQQGVTVDMTHSSVDTVWLKNTTSSSSGTYVCEVQGEAPGFAMVYDKKNLSVHLLPENGPVVTGGQDAYRIGEVVDLNCTSAASRPETQLKWWINNELASSEYLLGPWISPSKARSDAFITKLELNFRVQSKHFKDGAMQLKCEASLPPMYSQESAVDVDTPFLEPSSEAEETIDGEVIEKEWGYPSYHNEEEFNQDSTNQNVNSANSLFLNTMFSILLLIIRMLYLINI